MYVKYFNLLYIVTLRWVFYGGDRYFFFYGGYNVIYFKFNSPCSREVNQQKLCGYVTSDTINRF